MYRFFIALIATLFVSSTLHAQAGYKIRSGDTLKVEVLEDSSLNRTLLVLPDGSVSYLNVGTFAARGRTVDQVRNRIAAGLAESFATEPNVFVSVDQVFVAPPKAPAPPKEKPVVGIFLMGEVNAPGKITADPGITLLQAIASAGGLTKFAATKRILLRRTDNTGTDRAYRYNYDNPRAENSLPSNFRLKKGDVIVVPARKLFE